MKRVACILLTLAFFTLGLAGCQQVSPAEPSVTNYPFVSPSVAPSPVEPSDESPSQPVYDPEPEDSLEEFFSSVFPDGDMLTGYIADSDTEVTAMIAKSGLFNVKSLTVSTLNADIESGENETTFYKFTMANTEDVQELGGDYLTKMTFDEETYYVAIGNSAYSTYEEALIYCSEGSTITYFAMGAKEDGITVLIPIVAGSEGDGYWAVRPALAYIGFDVSAMASLVGDSTPSAATGMVTLDLTDYEDDGEDVIIYYTLTNEYSFAITLFDVRIYLNGEDVTEKSVFFFEAGANAAQSDCFFFDAPFEIGDTLEIYGIVNDEKYEEIEEVWFSFTFN